MILAAIRAGWRQALGGRRMVCWLWLLGLVAAAPAAVVMQRSFEGAIGPSLVHERLRGGLDMEWLYEYAEEARGLETSVTASSLTKAGLLDNLELWFSGDLFLASPALVAMGVLYLLTWSYLLGGVLEQLIRPVPRLTVAHFLRSGGRFLGRFVRLVLLSAPLYLLIYKGSRRLFAGLEIATRDVTAETTVLAVHLIGALLVVLLLLLVHIGFTYARIATVTEDRRSALGAALRGVAFVLRHPLRTATVYGGVALGGLLVLLVYWLIAPGLGGSSWLAIAWAFLLAQGYLFARATVRVALLGGQAELYRRIVHGPGGGS